MLLGGGDWSDSRLIPDCVKSWSINKKVLIRNPKATRPWQHVLEAVYGYLLLASKLEKNKNLHGQAFNFGPKLQKNYSVIQVVKTMKNYWDKVSWKTKSKKQNYFMSQLFFKLNFK